MSEINATTRLRRQPEAAYRIIDGTAIIVLPRDARILTLNRVGSRIWEALGGATVQELAAIVTREFRVGLDRALADTITFLTDLRNRGLAEEE